MRFNYTAARRAGFTDEDIAKSLAAKRAQGIQVFVDPAEVQKYRNAFTQGPAPYPGALNENVEAAKSAAGASAYPATWLMRQVGARVDAGEAGAIRALTGQGPFFPSLGEGLAGYVTGNPPKGLPREQASYTALRNAGVEPGWATAGAIAGSIPAAGPLNLVGGLVAEPAMGLLSAVGKAAVRATPATRSLARMISRTGEMTPKDAATAERLFEQARGEQRAITFQGEHLANQLDALDKSGQSSVAARTAAENLGRYGERALDGLTPAEAQAARDVRGWLDVHPAQRQGFGLKRNELGSHVEEPNPNAVSYFPRFLGPGARQQGVGSRYGGAAESFDVPRGAHRTLSPELTTTEANAQLAPAVQGGNYFEPSPAKAIRAYAGKEGIKRRNATLLQSLAGTGRPISEAPPDWVPLGKVASQAGLNEATQASLAGVSIKPEWARYANDFVRGTMPENERNALAFSRQMGSAIKPLLTITNPGFLQKFMGWHALKLTIDGEANPRALELAVKAIRNRNPEAAVTLRGAPGIKTMGQLRDAMVRSGTYGGRGGSMHEILPGISHVAGMNTAVYDATKSTYLISRLMKGDDLTTAAIKAKRALLDYSPENFTNAENFVRQHVAYFYAFPRQIVPAFVRTLVGRPGSMGAMQEVSASAGARLGITPDQIQNDMGPAISEQGAVPISRSATNPDSVDVFRTTVNPFSHINQLFGQRERPGIQGPVDALSSMISSPIAKGAQFLTSPNYNPFLGKTSDPSRPSRAPSAARWIVQVAPDLARSMRLTIRNGQPYAPDQTVKWLYMMPQVLNAAADATNAQNPESRRRAREFLGLVTKQVDMAMQRNIRESRANMAARDSMEYEARLDAMTR